MDFDNLILTGESRASRSFVMHLAIRETDWQTEHRVNWSSDFHYYPADPTAPIGVQKTGLQYDKA
jgi:hypothetical protein